MKVYQSLLVLFLAGCASYRLSITSPQSERILEDLQKPWEQVHYVEGLLHVKYHQRGKLPALLRGSFRCEVPFDCNVNLYDVLGRKVIAPDAFSRQIRTIGLLWQGKLAREKFESVTSKKGKCIYRSDEKKLTVNWKKRVIESYETREDPELFYKIRAGRIKKISGIYVPHFFEVLGKGYYLRVELSRVHVVRKE